MRGLTLSFMSRKLSTDMNILSQGNVTMPLLISVIYSFHLIDQCLATVAKFRLTKDKKYHNTCNGFGKA